MHLNYFIAFAATIAITGLAMLTASIESTDHFKPTLGESNSQLKEEVNLSFFKASQLLQLTTKEGFSSIDSYPFHC